jgi:hypothetical protein
MFEQMMDTFRKTTESALRVQQQMMQQWAQGTGIAATPASTPMTEQVRAHQTQVAATFTEILKKHRETLDAQYGLGIQALEEAFRVGDSKDPAEFMKRTEELCKHGFDCIKAVADDQVRGFQAASEKWLEVVTKGTKVANG